MPRPPRIAIVVHSVVAFDPRIQRQVSALEQSGYEVDVFGLRQPGETAEERRGSVRFIRLPVNRWFLGFAGHLAEYMAFSAVALWSLARRHAHRHYDLVQVATVPDFLAFSALPERMVGVPLLLDLHEDMPEFFRDRFDSPMLRPLHPLVEMTSRAAAAVATELITVHEPLRQLAIDRGVDPNRITVVMNSADVAIFDPDRYPRRPFMADGVLKLVHHSNLHRLYGLDVAIRAIASIDDIPLRLDVYGDGPSRMETERVIAATGTSGRVFLHGRVALDQLPALLAASDIGLVPTLPTHYARFSLSTKLLEYAAMGVPTIASDLPTFRHYFTDKALYYATPGDAVDLARAIRDLAAHPEAAVARGQAARQEASSYAWDAQAAPISAWFAASRGPTGLDDRRPPRHLRGRARRRASHHARSSGRRRSPAALSTNRAGARRTPARFRTSAASPSCSHSGWGWGSRVRPERGPPRVVAGPGRGGARARRLRGPGRHPESLGDHQARRPGRHRPPSSCSSRPMADRSSSASLSSRAWRPSSSRPSGS